MVVAVVKDAKVPREALAAVCNAVGLNNGEPSVFPGAIFECIFEAENGFQVVSIYDTEEHANANIDAITQAAAQVSEAMGVTPDPDSLVIHKANVFEYYTANASA